MSVQGRDRKTMRCTWDGGGASIGSSPCILSRLPPKTWRRVVLRKAQILETTRRKEEAKTYHNGLITDEEMDPLDRDVLVGVGGAHAACRWRPANISEPLKTHYSTSVAGPESLSVWVGRCLWRPRVALRPRCWVREESTRRSGMGR
jgi:hypothetical protein